MPRLLLLVGLALTAAQGCGHRSTVTSPTDASMPVYRIETATYAVSNIVADVDECALALTSATFSTLHVDNDGRGHLRLGGYCDSSSTPLACDPAGYSFGEGNFFDS